MRQNEQVVRDAVDAFKAGDVERFAGLLADNVVVHVPPGLPVSGDYRSRDEFLNGMVGKVVGALGGPPQIEVHDFVSSDDHVVGLYTIRAQRGDKNYEWRHVNVYHVSGGKITEFWWSPFDQEVVKQALG
jgi:ketosteroid isomerase-like protein